MKRILRGVDTSLKIICLASMVGLSACTSAQQTTVNAALTTAQADAQKALRFWGVIKGMAQVAEAAQPSLVPILAPRIVAIDALVAQATNAVTLAQGDAVAIEAIVTKITTQAQDVANAAAPAIKVVAGN